MRGRLLPIVWLIACTGGCSNPHGVAIEVHAGATEADSVELFIGRTPCHAPDCAGIAPPGVATKLTGEVAYRDGAAIDSAPMVGDVVTFELRPDHAAETLPIVIAVGYTGTTPSGVAVITDLRVSSEPEIVSATLEPATHRLVTLPASVPIADGVRVEVWREKMPPGASCVGVQRWHANVADTAFVVPADDPDCDDVPNGPLECEQDVFHASTAPTAIAGTTCVAPFDVAGKPTCKIGGPGCADGLGTVSCAPAPFCVPDFVCDASDCRVPSCVFDNVGTNMVPHLECRIPTQLGQPCLGGSKTATVDLDVVFTPATAQCTSLAFYSPLSGSQLQFTPTLNFNDGVEITATPPTPACKFDLTWTNHQASSPNLDRGLVEISIDNGEHVIIPIVVVYAVGQCGTLQMSCTPTYGSDPTGGLDGVWNCLE